MKLSDVLSGVGAESQSPAKAIRDQHLGQTQEAKAADSMPAGSGGYHKTGRAKTVHKQTTCCRCGHPIKQGETAVALKNDGWSCLSWVHPACEDGYGQAASTEQIETIASRLDSALLSEIDELKAKLVDLSENEQPATIRVQLPDRDVDLEGEHMHPAFDEIIDLVADGEDVFLPGPTGCGKSHVVEQVAKALDRAFGSISCSGGTTESHIFGRMVPYGEQGQFEFLGTEFLRCYENGGVFLLDEMDAADENVLIAINSALANGFVSVPSRHENPIARRHPDFVCVAAANTFGHGADRQYVGRTQLDPREIAASLGSGAVLLCWEAPGAACHRRRVAEWLESSLGIVVPEYGFQPGEIPVYKRMPEQAPSTPESGKRLSKKDTALIGYLEAIRRAEAEAVRRNTLIIQVAARESWQAAAWYLERRYPDTWGRKEKQELSGPRGAPIEVKGDFVHQLMQQAESGSLAPEVVDDELPAIESTSERAFVADDRERAEDEGTNGQSGTDEEARTAAD